MSNRDGRDLNDLSVRRVSRGEDARVSENDEWGIVLPKVDKIAVIGLTFVEVTSILTNATVWSPELHLVVIMAIAGLGGYSIKGGGSISTLSEQQESEDA